MSRLAPDRFLPYILGKWLQKSHNTEMWSCDTRNKKIIAQINKAYRKFEKVNITSRGTKDDSFINCETCTTYVKKTSSH